MITAADTPTSAIIKLAEGNPGALTVLVRLIKEDEVMGFLHLLTLDDMGMKGSSIWLGYKDFAKENLNTFIEALRTRDPEMVRVIKLNGGEAWIGGRS